MAKGGSLTTPDPGHTRRQHVFAEVPHADIERSSFDRSHGLKTTFNSMALVPIFVDEALPGDTFNLNATLLCRMATPIKPIMDNLWMDTFFFAVPYRLVWSNWVFFNGEQINPGDSTDFTIPQAVSPSGGYAVQSLQDYIGLPTGVAGYSHSNLWCRAYNLIYNDWFRDENLIDSVHLDLGNGPDTVTNYVVLSRGKRHDYFTSCLPWTQKGDAVTVPLGESGPVVVNSAGASTPPAEYPLIRDFATGTAALDPTAIAYVTANVGGGGFFNPGMGWTPSPSIAGSDSAYFDPNGSLVADLTGAAFTINALRQSFQIQKLLERDARGGTRYTEIIRSHFGVVSPDARLQRPEYLGGGSQRINVLPVAQTSVSAATPQGNLAAYSASVSHRNGFTKSFTEHCLIIGLVNVRADLTYQQGLNRMFSRNTRYDFFWPALAHIGEQAVFNMEIYCQGTAGGGDDGAVFGYQERYAEYRYKPSVVTGMFRSTYADTLDFWHLADKYTALPTLGSVWIEAPPPMARIEAVTEGAGAPDFLLDCHFDLRCARPMPVYGVPGLIDHF